MQLKRALSAATAICVVAATTVFAGSAASAADSLTNQELADAAAAAAAAADQAFIDAKWDKVAKQADKFDAAYDKLLARLAALQDDLADAQDALSDAQDALDQALVDAANADAAIDDAQAEHDAAVSAFNQSVATALGAPSWWTTVFTNPIKISDVDAAIDQAHIDIEARQAAVDDAQAAYDTAVGAVARALALANLGVARVALEAAQLRLQVLSRAYEEVDGPAREQRVQDAADALDAAHATANQAADRVDQGTQAVSDAHAAIEDLEGQIAALEALLDSLADAARSVADRRADLEDLAEVKRVVVWTMGADNDKPRAGDTIKLNFSIPNSELFDLSDAKVKVLSPSGVKADCDIVGGVVAAAATVHCTAEYLTTEKDAAKGEVVFEVQLRGYIPLGPGNPRGQAVNRTLITANATIEVPVAAALTDGSLPETGLESPQLLAIAASLIAVGAVLIVRRDRIAIRS